MYVSDGTAVIVSWRRPTVLKEDNRDLLEEYNHDAPAPGSDSEAEEDNSADPREDMPIHESPMNAVSPSLARPPSSVPVLRRYASLSFNQDSSRVCFLLSYSMILLCPYL